MSGSSRADLAAAATSTVLTADQIMKAIEASHEGKEAHAKKHIGYAAIGAAVAVGAMELFRRDELDRQGKDEDDDNVVVLGEHNKCGHHHHDHDSHVLRVDPKCSKDHVPPGHSRRLAEEIIGAYSLGQEIMGNKKHHVAHVVAEAIGAIAAMKDTRDHVSGVE
ncbi:hypothetical protein ACJQWK_11179 [Exserohilum turcicum]|uniref:Uncharacterized protein n=1 Tax=Exserohilum turcicum (strain 28A) TaxID=671987 RepID=R0KSS4_EXST2|nr:uncharacterized protein SETTUDRAFT_45121 [Exserohilum turcica Et28A]EOA90857.1 hypothetical protein SETTUDRAFT_45121 [Exserohilum turcica Et28A]